MRIERFARIGGLTTFLLGMTGVLVSEYCVKTPTGVNQGILEANGLGNEVTKCKNDFPKDRAAFRSCLQREVDVFAARKAQPEICNESSADRALVIFDENLDILRSKAVKGRKPPSLHAFFPESWQLASDRKALAVKLKQFCDSAPPIGKFLTWARSAH